MIDSLDLLAARKNQLFIVHQTGERDYNAVRVAYARREIKAEVLPFIENMAERFAQADLIVCRSGAITVGGSMPPPDAPPSSSPSAPPPTPPDPQRRGNAERRRGAAAPADAADARTPDTTKFFPCSTSPGEFTEMAERARALATPRAVEDIVDLIEEGGARHDRTFRNFKRIHLVGIGGIGMSGIAEVLLRAATPFRVRI